MVFHGNLHAHSGGVIIRCTERGDKNPMQSTDLNRHENSSRSIRSVSSRKGRGESAGQREGAGRRVRGEGRERVPERGEWVERAGVRRGRVRCGPHLVVTLHSRNPHWHRCSRRD